MKRTTGLVTTGALALGTTALLSGVAPGVASASDCGVTTLDMEAFTAAFNSAYTFSAGATATMQADGLHLTTDGDENNSYVAFFTDVEIPLSEAYAQSNFGMRATLAAGQPATNHPTYDMLLDLDGPDLDGLSPHFVWQEDGAGDVWQNQGLVLDPDASEAVFQSTLAEVDAAYPDAVVVALGLQLAYQPNADVLVHGMTFGCNEFVFSSGEGPGGEGPGGEDPDPTDNQAPLASVTSTNTGRVFTFSAAGSTDSDGEIVDHSWDFGDGSEPGQGEQVTHEYAAAGTYTVTLTVTDDGGAVTEATAEVVVPEATDPTDPTDPTVGDGVFGDDEGEHLPNTGADVLGLAAVGGLILAGGGAGLVASRRRKAGSAS